MKSNGGLRYGGVFVSRLQALLWEMDGPVQNVDKDRKSSLSALPGSKE